MNFKTHTRSPKSLYFQRAVKIDRLATLLKMNGVAAKWESKLGIDDLARVTAGKNPAIAHVKVGNGDFHYVVVDGVTERLGKRVVAIRDPGDGTAYFQLVDDFLARFTGNVVVLP